jgi:L-seryl-tRNA(Ser) seleniumtransferase
MASGAISLPQRRLPSVDQLLRLDEAVVAVKLFGHAQVVAALRESLQSLRGAMSEAGGHDVKGSVPVIDDILSEAITRLEASAAPRVRQVFNLTGTVLHTNLGRAVLAEEAIEAAARAMRNPTALEFDLGKGSRGERDDLVRGLLSELTGAEDATVVNNNAAAVLLTLNTLADDRDAVISRGELIEIGGAFRMPDIIAAAGSRILEVGTTNRTHLRDYARAIGPDTGLLLKVHTSNYRIQGFTKEVPAPELALLAKEHNTLLVNDLGSGTLVDLSRFGLSKEPTVADAIREGADIVTFSGDKLLGGPQAGFIIGRRELITRINRNPMKRAMRVDKIRLAALEATLRLYLHPERLTQQLPTLRHLVRSPAEIEALAHKIMPAVAASVGSRFSVEVAACASQIGSGALPLETVPSFGLAIRTADPKASGQAIASLTAAFRALPVPVIGRIADQALIFDLRCLEDAAAFTSNLSHLELSGVQ